MMKKVLLSILIVLSYYLVSCEKKEKDLPKQEAISPSKSYLDDFNNNKKVRELSGRIAEKGDTLAYNELKEIYFFSSHSRDFLRNSLIMADNFDYSKAYFDVYFILKNDSIDSINIKTNKLADYYLLKAYEKGVEDAKYSVKERFGRLAELPKSKDYWVAIGN